MQFNLECEDLANYKKIKNAVQKDTPKFEGNFLQGHADLEMVVLTNTISQPNKGS